MQKKFGMNDAKINVYVDELFPEDAILKEIRERSQKAGLQQIQVGPLDARHLEVITQSVGAKKAVEIGTLAGYSGVSILRGLAKGGRLYTFEINPKTAAVARESFKKAGFEKEVTIFVGPASDNLPQIEKEGPFDLVFLDADKTGYVSYFKWAEKNLRVGGVVLADNTFAWGKIANTSLLPSDSEAPDVRGLQNFNRAVAKNTRFKTTLLPTGEGLLMAVKMT